MTLGRRRRCDLCTFEHRWHFATGDFAAASLARVELRLALREQCRIGSDVEAAEIIFGELLSNALRHGGAGATADVRCRAGSFVLEIADEGPGFDLEQVGRVERTDDGGRGLEIADRLGAKIRTSRRDGKWVVEALLPVACPT